MLILILSSAFIVCLPRRYATIPVLCVMAYLTQGQQLILANFNLYPIRIIIIFGWLRLFLRGEWRLLQLNIIDKIFILWVFASLITYSLLYQTTQAFVYKVGFVYDVTGLYFLFRCLIKGIDDIVNIFSIMAILILPLAIFMLYEYNTNINMFSYFGGVPEHGEIRDGRIRCRGAFQHPILAGSFGASMLPLFSALWRQKGKKIISVIGIVSSTIIVVTSSSSGPLMAYITGLAWLGLWRYRAYMKYIVWSSLGLVVILGVIMKAPIYYIIDRIAGITGGSGWYRSYLIEQFIEHFGEWWLLGTKESAKWMPFYLTDSNDRVFADITNHYVAQGVNGGLLTLTLFILIIVLCIRTIGSTLKQFSACQPAQQYLIWTINATLIVHLASFLSVSYYDQVIVAWLLLLSMISMLLDKHYAQTNIRCKHSS